MLLSKWAICDTEKSRFIRKQEANGSLSSLGTKTALSEIPLLGYVSFWMQFYWMQFQWMKFHWMI